MRERRHRKAERVVYNDLFGSVGNMVVPANDMGDTHERVVHDAREVVRGRAVGFDEHLVLDDRRVEFDPAADEIVDLDFAGLDLEDDRPA